ncbi:MAG: hypothetical protein WCJ33_00775 [Pseudomonadota bacterium]
MENDFEKITGKDLPKLLQGVVNGIQYDLSVPALVDRARSDIESVGNTVWNGATTFAQCIGAKGADGKNFLQSFVKMADMKLEMAAIPTGRGRG